MKKIYTIFCLFVGFCFFPLHLSAENFKIYKVKEGDTLTKISKEQLNDQSKWKELLNYNKIENPNLIKPGLELRVPDSLAKIVMEEPPIAKIDRLIGIVKIKKNKTADFKSATTGSFLQLEDTIQTEDKSAADINYFEDPEVIIKLKKNSIMKLKKANVKTAELSLGEAFFSVFRKKTGTDTILKVITPSAQAGVRGTVFGVSSDKEETSKFSCTEGIVDVTAQGKSVTLQAGFGTMVKKGEAPGEPYPLPGEIKMKPTEK